jgi:hypothetical protein
MYPRRGEGGKGKENKRKKRRKTFKLTKRESGKTFAKSTADKWISRLENLLRNNHVRG